LETADTVIIFDSDWCVSTRSRLCAVTDLATSAGGNILAYSRIIFFRARSRTSSSTVSLVTKR
jgi:hypothetical protein